MEWRVWSVMWELSSVECGVEIVKREVWSVK